MRSRVDRAACRRRSWASGDENEKEERGDDEDAEEEEGDDGDDGGTVAVQTVVVVWKGEEEEDEGRNGEGVSGRTHTGRGAMKEDMVATEVARLHRVSGDATESRVSFFRNKH